MTHPPILSALAGVSVSIAIFATAAPAGAAGPQPLFGVAAGKAATVASQHRSGRLGHRPTQRPEIALPGKDRAVRIDRDKLSRERLLLNLGVGPDLDVVRERLVQRGPDREAWIGRVAGDSDSEVILTRAGTAVAGSIRHRGRLYRLTPGAGGSQNLAEVQPQTPLPSSEAVPDLIVDEGDGGTVGAQAGSGATIIDLLFGYTPEAKARYGSADGVEAVIALAVEETNQAFLNSGAPVELRLVAMAETDYHDTGDMNTDLIRLTLPTDGHADDLATLREAVGADLVSLLVDTGGYCGLSWQLGALDPVYSAYAFSVVNTLCATGYYSAGHEIGHNLGLSHDHDNATSGLFPYSYGYQDATAQFRTIMAYNCDAGCTRVQHFSNPDVDFGAAPTGVAGWADNALALMDTAPVVATWRDSLTPFPPTAPADLTAAAAGADAIDLGWTDTSAEESGFTLERSDDGGQTFAVIATLPADTNAHTDTGLLPETGYLYRVSAYNGAGTSGWSNDAWATTDPAPVQPPATPTDLTALVVSDTEIALAWTDNAGDETAFEVERSNNGGLDWSPMDSLPADTTGWTDSGLDAGTWYLYRVRAVGHGGASGWSNAAGATTLAPMPECAASGAGTILLGDRDMRWQISNDGADAITISRVELTWPSSQSYLKRMLLDGSQFWNGSDAPTTADIDGGWSDPAALVLDAGQSATLRFDFKRRDRRDNASEYAITVHFAGGCAIQF